VTGDLANRGKREEMLEARAYLGSLLDDLWGRKQAARCVLIPGNHDVWRTTWARRGGYCGRQNRLDDWNEVFDDWSFVSPVIPKGRAAHLGPLSLLKYYLNHGGRGGGPAASRSDAEILAARAQRACEFFPAYQLAFLKLDSNVRLNKWKPGHIARGMVGLAQR